MAHNPPSQASTRSDGERYLDLPTLQASMCNQVETKSLLHASPLPFPARPQPLPEITHERGKKFRQSRSCPHLPLHPRPQARSPYPFLREIVWFPYPAVRHRSLRRFPTHPPQLSPHIPSSSPIRCPPQHMLFDEDRQPRSSLTLPLTTRRDGQQRRRIACIGGRRARRQEEEGKRGCSPLGLGSG